MGQRGGKSRGCGEEEYDDLLGTIRGVKRKSRMEVSEKGQVCNAERLRANFGRRKITCDESP